MVDFQFLNVIVHVIIRPKKVKQLKVAKSHSFLTIFFFSENVLVFANFRPNWQHWAKDNSKTTCPIFDFLTPFYTYLLGLQKTVKFSVSKLHSLLTICCTIWKRQKFQNIIAYNHATSHRTVLTHSCNPSSFWFSYKSLWIHQNAISTSSYRLLYYIFIIYIYIIDIIYIALRMCTWGHQTLLKKLHDVIIYFLKKNWGFYH